MNESFVQREIENKQYWNLQNKSFHVYLFLDLPTGQLMKKQTSGISRSMLLFQLGEIISKKAPFYFYFKMLIVLCFPLCPVVRR